MKKKTILVVAGVMSSVIGGFMIFPTLAQGNYLAMSLFTLLLIIGLILLAIVFED